MGEVFTVLGEEDQWWPSRETFRNIPASSREISRVIIASIHTSCQEASLSLFHAFVKTKVETTAITVRIFAKVCLP